MRAAKNTPPGGWTADFLPYFARAIHRDVNRPFA